MLERIAIAAALFVALQPVQAQTERSGNADARVMQQLQQITAERAALQSENAKLKQELEALKRDAQKLTSDKSAADARLKAFTAEASREQSNSKQSSEQLEKTRAQLQELVTRFRETANDLRDAETERGTLRSQLAGKEREFKTCVDRNAGLYNLNDEVLTRMERRGFWTNIGELEMFTQQQRVHLENLIDGYKYRADELKLEAQKQAQAGSR